MKHLIILAASLLVFFSCTKQSEQATYAESIAKMEQAVLLDAKSIEPQKADSLVKMYTSYVALYPQDSLSAVYLFRAADVLANRKECLQAIDLLNKLIKNYPKDTHAEQAAFLKGVIYQETCMNKEKAVEAFNAFIAVYPNSSLVKDAQGLLQLNQVEDELEMIHRWEEQAEK